MDAINKFTGIQQSFVSEAEQVQSESIQTPQQVPNTGIGRTTDGFENFQQSTLDLSNITNPEATTEDYSVGTPTETLEPSTLFDFLNSDNSFAPGEALGKKLPPVFSDILPGDALGKKLVPAAYSVLPGDAPEKKLPPTLDELHRKLEPKR